MDLIFLSQLCMPRLFDTIVDPAAYHMGNLDPEIFIKRRKANEAYLPKNALVLRWQKLAIQSINASWNVFSGS